MLALTIGTAGFLLSIIVTTAYIIDTILHWSEGWDDYDEEGKVAP